MGHDETDASLEHKFLTVERMAKSLERLRHKSSAGEVFAEFGPEAAKLKVVEMMNPYNDSSDRQRAQETVLGYALGKPIERTQSLTVQISNMDRDELESALNEKLNRLGHRFGIEGGVGGNPALLIEDGGDGVGESVKEFQATSAIAGDSRQAIVSGEVLKVQEED